MVFQGWLAEVFGTDTVPELLVLGASLKCRHGAEKCLIDCLENMDYE